MKFKYYSEKSKTISLNINELVGKKRYTIDDLAKGKCIVFNSGNFKALQKVLELSYPKDSTRNLLQYWKYKFFGGVDFWEYSDNSEVFGNLPIQGTELFLTENELKNNSDEVEYPINFLIDQLNKRAGKLGLGVDVTFKNIQK